LSTRLDDERRSQGESNGPLGSVATASGDVQRAWHASLTLGFEHEQGRTRLARRAHRGPLVVQKPLYPEDAALCQCVIVHPPAGIVGGDRLDLAVTLGNGSLVQLTTPGATKWYRSVAGAATQRLHMRLGDRAALEWLPQGAIVYDGAVARSAVTLDVASTSTFIGIDIVALGRRASDEPFRCGEWRQRIDVTREGAPIWSERAIVGGGEALLSSPVGLNGATVFGTFMAVGPRLDRISMTALRDVVHAIADAGVTRLPDAIVARYLGDSLEEGQRIFATLWSVVRPVLVGRVAIPPRIWRT
jgi:urease accessory protein